MRIKSVFIKNFRRLQSCKIDIGEKETIFVGANNSGKTTAMDALLDNLPVVDIERITNICTFLIYDKFPEMKSACIEFLTLLKGRNRAQKSRILL
ncbi:MAG: AAA family ATPase [Alistipes sp.]